MSRGPGAHDAASHRWWALVVTSLGALLASLNMSTLVIALPSLLRSLHTGLIEVVWVLLSYLLAQTALVLSAGRLGDVFGRKPLYTGGFALFTVMALASGFAGTPLLLIGLRVLAGCGGALMLASSAAIVTDAFPRRELGLALGINAMVIAVGAAIGPVLGGWLTSISCSGSSGSTCPSGCSAQRHRCWCCATPAMRGEHSASTGSATLSFWPR